jgi:ectoine hydroxylase-related dioxygenase (phytanoyl-CoA dioxygenase family)
VALEVPAGSLVFFDPHIVHGSGPNTSEAPRRALILTYQPAGHPTLKSRQIRNIR